LGSRFSRQPKLAPAARINARKSRMSTSIRRRDPLVNVERTRHDQRSEPLVRALAWGQFRARAGDHLHSGSPPDVPAVPSSPLSIPDHVSFADLQLEREHLTGRLLYFPAPLTAVIGHNGDDPARVLADEDLACFYLAEWYFAHRLSGGHPDPIAEQIIRDVAQSPDAGTSH
jgi:hypothetical protein